MIFTPGHSPGHVTYAIAGRDALFSGDVLFQGSVGRVDLPGGDWPTLLASIESLLDALRRRHDASTRGTWGSRRSAPSARPTRSCAELARPVTAVIQAPRGTFDVLPEHGRRRAGSRRSATRDPRRGRLPPHRDADVRGDRAVRPRRGGGDRHRPEGDVHVRRRRRALADAAPRGHRAGLPRLRRARHAQAAPAGEALVPGPASSAHEAPQAGPLPPVLADRRRGARLRRPGGRRRADPAAGRRCWASSSARGVRLRALQPGQPRRRALATARSCSAYLRAHEDRLSEEVRGRIDLNPLRAFDADRPGHPGGDARRAAAAATASTPTTPSTSPQVRALLRRRAASPTRSTRRSCAASTTTRARSSSSPRRARRPVRRRRRRALRRADRAARRPADARHGLGGRDRADPAGRRRAAARRAAASTCSSPGTIGPRREAFALVAEARARRAGRAAGAGRPLAEGPAQAGRSHRRPLRCHRATTTASRLKDMQCGEQVDGRPTPTRSSATSCEDAGSVKHAPRANRYRDPGPATLGAARAGDELRVAGWVHRRRDHGGLIFIDLRDRSGLLQLVFHPETSRRRVRRRRAPALRGRAVRARASSCARGPGNVNPNLATGEIELHGRRARAAADADDAAVPGRRGRRTSTRTCACRTASLDLRREPMRDALGAAPPRSRDDARRSSTSATSSRSRRRSSRAPRPRARATSSCPAALQPGIVLRAAAVAAAVQAAADDRRLRALLPDRPLLPRRGPARRPPARVHPARRRDVVRRRGRRHRA